jgi:Amidohydrolase ring-opening protein (Amido_AtzD_TrzD)
VRAIASFFSCNDLLRRHRRSLEPHEIGTLEHAELVREVVSSMLEELGVVNPGQVFVKCPLLTSVKLEAIRDTGKPPVTEDTYESMAKSVTPVLVASHLPLVSWRNTNWTDFPVAKAGVFMRAAVQALNWKIVIY